jgi:hypothetical protein
MYHYLDDKEFVSKMRSLCGDIMKDLCHILKEDYDIGATFYLVGSGKRKLIMQNNNEPVDLDYNLEIIRCEDFEDCRYIKESVRKAFNEALNLNDLSDCNDSTVPLTTELICFTEGNDTEFRMDVCITVRDEDDNYYRLVHEKTGFVLHDRYFWNIAPNSKRINEKVDYIKKCGKWILVRQQYEKIKNMYLVRNDYNHPSFICYVEAVNNVYNSRKSW